MKYILSLMNISLIYFCEFHFLKTYERLPNFPSDLNTLFCASISFCLADLLAYFVHYIYHKNKFLYMKIHSVHHVENNPNILSTVFMHPIEILSFFLIYRFPILIGIPFNKTTFLGYQIILIIWTCLDHSTNKSIFADHFQHHKYKKGNYATCIQFYDSIFGTKINFNK